MSEHGRREVRTGFDPCLARLWRYVLLLTARTDAAEDLVQATCLRAVERADQFVPGTRLEPLAVRDPTSIWLNEIHVRRISEGGGFVDAEDPLSTDGEQAVETNILAADGFQAIGVSPEAQRETVLLVYGEGYSYAEAASTLDWHRDKRPRRGAFLAGHAIVRLTYNASLSLQPPYRQIS